MNIHAIINPVSGRRHLGAILRRVRQGLERRGVGLVCWVTRVPGDATRIASRIPDDARGILVVGGDGTVRETAEGVMGRPLPLAVLPGGTENLIAKAFGMPRNPDAAVARMLDGVPQPMDVGLVNDRRFLIVSGVGFDAEVVNRLHRTRTGHITHFDYAWPIWRTFCGHSFPRLDVEVDGWPLYEGPALAFVGILPRYSVGLRILDRAHPDDGLLDVCIYPCSSRRRLVWHSVETVLRRHATSGHAIYARCRTLTIRSARPVPVQVDGDLGGATPAQYGIVPRAISFFHAPSV